MPHNSNNAIENANSPRIHQKVACCYYCYTAVNIHFVPFHFPCTSSTSMNLMKNQGPMYYISRTKNMHIKQECCVCILFLCINNKYKTKTTRGAHTKCVRSFFCSNVKT